MNTNVAEKTVIPSVLDGINPLRVRFIPYNARLVDARKAKGWTQVQLGMLTGIRLTELGHIETLRQQPTEEQKSELASALEASAEYLFPESLMGIIREGLISEKRVANFGDEHLTRLLESRKLLMLEAGKRIEGNMYDSIVDPTLREQIKEVLATLKPREQEILRMRFGLDGKDSRTLEEIGREFGLGSERIRQIEAKALRKLRHPARSRILKDYLE